MDLELQIVDLAEKPARKVGGLPVLRFSLALMVGGKEALRMNGFLVFKSGYMTPPGITLAANRRYRIVEFSEDLEAIILAQLAENPKVKDFLMVGAKIKKAGS